MSGPAVGNASIVDKNIQSTPCGEHGFDHGCNLLSSRKITMSGQHFDATATRLARHLIDFDVIDVYEIQIDTLAGERQRDRTSDSGRRTGDQRLLSAQDFHYITISFCKSLIKRRSTTSG